MNQAQQNNNEILWSESDHELLRLLEAQMDANRLRLKLSRMRREAEQHQSRDDG